MNNRQEELLKVIALAEAVQKDLTLAISRAKAEYETYLVEIPEPKQEQVDLPWEESTAEPKKSFYMVDFTNEDKAIKTLKFIAETTNEKFILNLDGYKFHKLFVGSTTPKDNKCIYLPWVGHNTYGLDSVNAYEYKYVQDTLNMLPSDKMLLNAALMAVDNSDFVIITNDDSKESKSVLLQEIRNICKNQNKPLYNITKEKDLKDLVNYVNQA